MYFLIIWSHGAVGGGEKGKKGFWIFFQIISNMIYSMHDEIYENMFVYALNREICAISLIVLRYDTYIFKI